MSHSSGGWTSEIKVSVALFLLMSHPQLKNRHLLLLSCGHPSVCVCVLIPSSCKDTSAAASGPTYVGLPNVPAFWGTGGSAFSVGFGGTQFSPWEGRAESSSQVGGRKAGECNVVDAKARSCQTGWWRTARWLEGKPRMTRGHWLWGHVTQHPVKPSHQLVGRHQEWWGREEQAEHRGFRAVRLLCVTLSWWTRVIVQTHTVHGPWWEHVTMTCQCGSVVRNALCCPLSFLNTLNGNPFLPAWGSPGLGPMVPDVVRLF